MLLDQVGLHAHLDVPSGEPRPSIQGTLGLPRVSNLLGQGALRMYLPHVLSLADIAPANPPPLAPLTLLVSFQTAASVLGLAGPVEYACPPQVADVLASQSVATVTGFQSC